ncbi:IclR family transcriptional regulator C-terminal domain-containing protein, partial [Streptomyces carpinensis]
GQARWAAMASARWGGTPRRVRRVSVSIGEPVHTLVVREDLDRTLAEIRELGWGAEVQEMSMGDAGIAAPIRGHGGLVVGAIGLSGAVERICDTRGRPLPALIALLREAARAISRDLGAVRW